MIIIEWCMIKLTIRLRTLLEKFISIYMKLKRHMQACSWGEGGLMVTSRSRVHED